MKIYQLSDDIFKAHRVGEEVYQNLKKNCLEKDPPTVKFHEKMIKQNLKTFINLKRKKVGGKDLTSRHSETCLGI